MQYAHVEIKTRNESNEPLQEFLTLDIESVEVATVFKHAARKEEEGNRSIDFSISVTYSDTQPEGLTYAGDLQSALDEAW